MQLKSIFLGQSFDEMATDIADKHHAAQHYAIALCGDEQAHLSVFMGVPSFSVPGVSLVPLSNALIEEVNATRKAHAEETAKKLASAATLAGITAEFHIIESSYADTRDRIAATSSSLHGPHMKLPWIGICSRPCSLHLDGRSWLFRRIGTMMPNSATFWSPGMEGPEQPARSAMRYLF
ncbi:MAG TPA: hypothetical protein VME69_10415 [Methylocella sp.]|nr:hypothetical protein [Methylocella sp.]